MAKRVIEIEKCTDCPYWGKCKAYKQLTPKQKFTLKTGCGVGDFILKGCHLDEHSNPVECGLLVISPHDAFYPTFFKQKDHFGAASMKLNMDEQGDGTVEISQVYIKSCKYLEKMT